MLLFNPTGGVIRVDPAGDGHFGSKRESHTHAGIDLTIPTDNVWSPIEGVLDRKAYPYVSDLAWQGAYIIGSGRDLPFNVKMFYFVPDSDLVGKPLKRGQRVGTPQHISRRYQGQGMIDHIHFEVEIKPFMLLNKDGKWNTGIVRINPAILLGIDTYTKR
jgi:hypothetical protein